MEVENADDTNSVVSDDSDHQLSSTTTLVLRAVLRDGSTMILRLLSLPFDLLRVLWNVFLSNIIVRRICFEITDAIALAGEELHPRWITFRDEVRYLIDGLIQYVQECFRRYVQERFRRYRDAVKYFWNKCTWTNIKRCSSILLIYRKMPYDQFDRIPNKYFGHVKVKHEQGLVSYSNQ